VVFGTVSVILLLVYLSIPWLQKKLSDWYFPIALVITTFISLVAMNLFLYFQLPYSGSSSEETAWQLFLFLFIPLVLIGWQYDFKAVVTYCLFTAILDYALMACGRDDFYLFDDSYKRLIFIRTLSFLIAGYVIARVVEQMRRQRLALHEANRKLTLYATTLEQLAVSRERNRMARELHDTLAHTLSGLAVQLEGVKSLWQSDPQKSSLMLDQSLEATRSGLSETRKAIQSLRATPLEDLGLLIAIQEMALAAAERAGFQIQLELPESLGEIPGQYEQCIYRVAQESLENIVKHAGAEQVILKLHRLNGGLVLTITDDGGGFDPDAVDQEHHFGIRGICERAEMVEARLQIESQHQQGTTIHLEIGNHDKDSDL
jgi:signal transduction histidine kinase